MIDSTDALAAGVPFLRAIAAAVIAASRASISASCFRLFSISSGVRRLFQSSGGKGSSFTKHIVGYLGSRK